MTLEFPYKCFEVFDWPIKRKNFTNSSIKECFETFIIKWTV